MHEALKSPILTVAASGDRVKDLLFAGGVAILATTLFSLIFNRATVLSYSIGYNLYASERALLGDVPYRDFHSLYPPGTIYVNAAMFKWLGISLYSAMLGVLAFKVVTVLVLYASGLRLVSRSWAMAAVLLSLVWLRPNGAFKSVPMQYGALMLAVALYLLLKNEARPRLLNLFLSGTALGVLTLFKHNIGAYAYAGLLCFIFLTERGRRRKRHALAMTAGLATVIAPVLVYFQVKGALASMSRTLLFGSGEFLAGRLAVPRSPALPAELLLVMAGFVYAAYLLRRWRAARTGVWLALILLVAGLLLMGEEPVIDRLVFYVPIFLLVSGLFGFGFVAKLAVEQRRALFLTGILTASAFLELFPRLAREQSIAAMPFVILFAMYMLYLSRPLVERLSGGAMSGKLALAVLPAIFLLIGARLFVTTYFDNRMRFISNTQLMAERGGGVYFPETVAKTTDEIVRYIQERVRPDEYVFSQSNAGSPYLFLSGRRNPSSAQFWRGVGVTASEREATLEEIERRQVKLIITNDQTVAAETYEPLRDYISRNFKSAARFDKVLILSR